MAMASLNASLLAPKGCAQPAARAPVPAPASTALYSTVVGQITPSTRNVPKKPQEGGRTQQKKTKKKSLRLSAAKDKDLRLLAVRNGMSQQALLERAVNDYLDRAFAEGDCICRR